MTLGDSEYLKSLMEQGQSHEKAMIFNHIRLHHPQEKVAGENFKVRQLPVKCITCTPHTLHPKKLQDF